MSIEDNKAFIRRYMEATGQDKSTATLAEYMADEALEHLVQLYETAFPGYLVVAEDIIAEGDKVVMRGILHGTHTGDLMGIAPTQREVLWPLVFIYRIADGKIAEHWLIADQLGLLQQLGVLPG